MLLKVDDQANNFFHKNFIEKEWADLHIEVVHSAKEELHFLLSKDIYSNRPKIGTYS